MQRGIRQPRLVAVCRALVAREARFFQPGARRSDADLVGSSTLVVVGRVLETEGVELPGPKFATIAEAFGARGILVTERSELSDALAEMFKCDGPVVVDVHVEPEENVWPMVPTGKGLSDMDLGTLA